MRKVLCIALALLLLFSFAACGGESDRIDLTEETFFYGMTTIQMYPEEYYGKVISYDCFTYRLTDVTGTEYVCGVRKCSAGYGCKCGKDSIIGFILDYDGVIPEPKNQSVDTPDKTWVHLEGSLASVETQTIDIYGYDGEQINYERVESVVFCRFKVTSLSLIEDYAGLAYYVTK